MSAARVKEALALWGLERASASLAARRENEVWKVRDGTAAFALRFHRPGYRSEEELTSELQWMAMLAQNDVAVPQPRATRTGGFLGQIDGHCVSLLNWLAGHPIGAGDQLHGIANRPALAHALGAKMARLHDLSDAWTIPDGFTRPDWRRDALLGEAPLWGRFWDNPDLAPDQRALLAQTRKAANAQLAAIENDLDQGLIHADLLSENILIDDHGHLALIDFDDSAFGFRDFELATFLMRYLAAADYGEMRAALIDGYASRRAVNGETLDFFILLRALTYVGWIIARRLEPGGAERSTRNIARAISLAKTYLNGG